MMKKILEDNFVYDIQYLNPVACHVHLYIITCICK